jgi:hypothetical protein
VKACYCCRAARMPVAQLREAVGACSERKGIVMSISRQIDKVVEHIECALTLLDEGGTKERINLSRRERDDIQSQLRFALQILEPLEPEQRPALPIAPRHSG